MAGFEITKVVIIDSLKDWEFQTGEEIEKVMRHEFSEHDVGVAVERYSIKGASEFGPLIERLAREADAEPPLLHIEMHGDPYCGLVFADGSELTWLELSKLLAGLNEATRFNLVCVFAACYGAYLSHVLYVTHPSPCFAMIGPNDELDPGEVHRAFRQLYHHFAVSRDMGAAAEHLEREVPVKGGWFLTTMDRWFYRVSRAFAEDKASSEVLTRNARSLLQYINSPLRFGLPSREVVGVDMHGSLEWSFEHMRILLKLKTYDYLNRRAFNRFFMIDSIPENRIRFSAIEEAIKKDLIPLIDK